MTLIFILCLVGIIAIIAELVLPGGILGVVGIICLLVAVGMIFSQYGPTAGMISSFALLIIGIVATSLWMKYFHRLPVTRKFVLNEQVGRDGDLVHLQGFVGKTGTTVTEISPSGHAIIDGERIDVMTEAGSIPKDVAVEVIATRGPSIFVRQVGESD